MTPPRVFIPVQMAGSEEGNIELTAEELSYLVELGEVTVRSQHTRRIFLLKLGQFHETKDNAEQMREASTSPT